jgi:radical SAM superfamily enzyme YgiQ (UPF0313 family)
MNPFRVQFVQLPIPPAGPCPIKGNVPLAAGYLILYARQRGLAGHFDFQLLPTAVANSASDARLVEHILANDPWMVGFSCYLWNIQRTLWIAQRLKEHRPDLKIVVGGPEITADNEWVLQSSSIDYAVIGEGEQTFAELLGMYADCGSDDGRLIAGLWRGSRPQLPLFRKPLPSLDVISSPYLSGLLDAADEQMLLLETIRGCVFKCKFCYYPKSYDALYFVSEEKVVANLRHARQAGAREVVLLDPTLNQRKDFDDFLRLLARENPDQQFTYFGELRAEGIKPETARLLKAANFSEVEIGLQSIDPATQSLMDRRNNLKAFERGVSAMLDAGIEVKVDLIIGLPGDTRSSVRRGFEYLSNSRLFTSMQVFNLAILPGTAFRQEAEQLGLQFQPRPPYYVTETPTLKLEDLYDLMAEAQEVFETEWDPFPEPELEFSPRQTGEPIECVQFELDESELSLPPPGECCQALTLWFKSRELNAKTEQMTTVISQVLRDSPHSTLQIVLEPLGGQAGLDIACTERVLRACYSQPNYLDRYYSLNPAGLLGSKRVVVVLDPQRAWQENWCCEMEENATLVEFTASNPKLNYLNLSSK